MYDISIAHVGLVLDVKQILGLGEGMHCNKGLLFFIFDNSFYLNA